MYNHSLKVEKHMSLADLSYFDTVSSSVGRWWIGLVLDTVENVWVWDHSGNASTFTNWYPTEPTGNENCVLVENDGMWRDYPCNYVFNIICERK